MKMLHRLVQRNWHSVQRYSQYRLASSRSQSVVVTRTPNPKAFVYTTTTRAIPRITFFESAATLPSTQEELREEISQLLFHPQQQAIEVDITSPESSLPARKTFDPETPAGRVDKVIAERIRPGVNADGGDVELVELTSEGVAIVRLVGACNGCPSSDATLKNAIERTLVHFCAEDVKEVKQAESDIPTIDSSDFLGATLASPLDLPKVMSHNHVGVEMDTPLSQLGIPVVSLFAKKVDDKMVNRIKFASSVYIPKDAKSGIDVWVKCEDCGAKKRLEDVNQLLQEAKAHNQQPDTEIDRVAVVVCPACAVIVVEK